LLNSLALIGQLDSSLENRQKKFTNHLDLSGSNSYFRRLENVIKANYIIGFSANHKMIRTGDSRRKSFLSYGLNFQYSSIKFADIFRELKEYESPYDSYSINGHKDAMFVYAGINFNWGFLVNYKRIELEFFQRNMFNYLVRTNADTYSFIKDYGCTPPGIPSHCYIMNNSITYGNSLLTYEAGIAANLKLKTNKRLTVKYSNNAISWGFIRAFSFFRRLAYGHSIKEIREANTNHPKFEIGGGVRIRYFPDIFFINSLNFGYIIKI